MAQVVEHLPSKQEVQSSRTPVPKKKTIQVQSVLNSLLSHKNTLILGLDTVAHSCNHSYLGSQDKRIVVR
jgi:hypothetical protein